VKITLDLTGQELAVLYILCGNQDAGEILRRAIAEERLHNPPAPRLRRGRPGAKDAGKT
jgi:hypothetical protein